MNLEHLHEVVAKQRSKYAVVKAQLRNERQRMETCSQLVSDLEEAQNMLQSLTQQIQEDVHKRVGLVVTRCLRSVFGEAYMLHIAFLQKRGKTEAVFSVSKNDVPVDLLSASGGGVVDVVSFALRTAELMLRQPAPRRILILDEPFKFVSRRYQRRVRELVERMSVEMEIQFVVVSHISRLRLGHVVTIT